MKLVQLLAKELKEWPEGVDVYAQDPTGSVFPWTGSPDHDGEQWIISGAADFHMGVSRVIGGYSACDDHMTANVTKSQWQAEREKINKPKWIRHRGGKCPVADDVKVLYRMRSGTITSRGEPSSILSWDHSKSGADIMAYRVIEETKDQEIEEVRKFSKDVDMNIGKGEIIHGPVSIGDTVITAAHPKLDTNLGTLTYKLEIDATEATQQIDSLVAKWGQIESPLKWRDAIIHCQAIIEDCEREIERNVNLLDAEGLMMQKDSKKAMQHYAPDVDMSDWRNWQAGDVIEIVANEGGHQFENGEEVIVVFLDLNDIDMSVKAEYKDRSDYWWLSGKDAKFIRRP